MAFFWCYDSPFGSYTAAEDGVGICALYFGQRPVPGGWTQKETSLLKETALQLEEYFSGSRRQFDLPLSLTGTPFQLADWAALQDRKSVV